MPTLINSLGIDRMGVNERLQLIQEIWDGLEAETDVIPITEVQKQELDRRLAALDANPGAAVPWEKVEERALARFSR